MSKKDEEGNSECTIIVGNGLNREIDDKGFKLETGMNEVWNELDKGLKETISSLMNNKDKPENEDDLATIQEQIFYLESISNNYTKLDKNIKDKLKIEITGSENIDEFKNKYSEYLFRIAQYFFDKSQKKEISDFDEFEKFYKNLATYIMNRKDDEKVKTHITSLNYDCLLYLKGLSKSVEGKKLLGKRSETYLCDGFCNSVYEEKLHIQDNIYASMYLHLHGSPLFYSNDGRIKKDKISEIDNNKYKRNHIILCHPNQKYEMINKSELLSSYLKHFKTAIQRSHKIIILGYGGNDNYLNNVIIDNMQENAEIFIVEKNKKGIGKAGWEKIFKTKTIFIPVKNILEFDLKNILSKTERDREITNFEDTDSYEKTDNIIYKLTYYVDYFSLNDFQRLILSLNKKNQTNVMKNKDKLKDFFDKIYKNYSKISSELKNILKEHLNLENE